MPTESLEELGFELNVSGAEGWVTDGHSILRSADIVFDHVDLTSCGLPDGVKTVSEKRMQMLWDEELAKPFEAALLLGCAVQSLPSAYAAVRGSQDGVLWVDAYKLAFLAEITAADSLAVLTCSKWQHECLRLQRGGRLVSLIAPITPWFRLPDGRSPGEVYDLSAPGLRCRLNLSRPVVIQ